MKWLQLCCHCWKGMNLFCNLDVQCDFGRCSWNLSLIADCLEAPQARPMCLSGKSVLFLVKPSLSQDRVRFPTQHAESMRSSWNNESESWDLISFLSPPPLPLTHTHTDFAFYSCPSYLRGWRLPGAVARHEAEYVTAGRVGHSNMSASRQTQYG